ncbi:hypothetical protein FC820_17805 [Clostridium sporogenes]|uniref:hypothetical protein n=1 Tax=Clostridium sporogenes TaxID=1509 RepID=UPI0013D55E37|nr:hypothetical protein [Clostridium sporogenes]NFG70119.1 hypothetical protein [Clostridium sporogenes]
MEKFISIICQLALIGFIIFDYLKDKKVYRLLAILVCLSCIFFQIPLSNSISEISLNILVAINILIMIFIFYLILKDGKNQNNKNGF